MVYLDLDADGYRTATGKWSIKWLIIISSYTLDLD
jgi:hypothetical protein